MADSTEPNQDQKELLSKYFLLRLGLLPDEIDWPESKSAPAHDSAAATTPAPPAPASSPSQSLSSSASASTSFPLESFGTLGSAGGAWRVRDAITSIINSKPNPAAPAPPPTTHAAHTTHATPPTHGLNTSSPSTSLIPIEEILNPLLPNDIALAAYIAQESGDEADDDDDECSSSDEDNDAIGVGRDDLKPLNIKHVRRAFNAASFSIVRGNKRALAAAFADAGGGGGGFGAGSGGGLGNATTGTNPDATKGGWYSPPLIQAMEAIRTSRMQSLKVASGRTAPSFLKKNTTIPWFHVPPNMLSVTSVNSGIALPGAGGAGGGGAVAGGIDGGNAPSPRGLASSQSVQSGKSSPGSALGSPGIVSKDAGRLSAGNSGHSSPPGRMLEKDYDAKDVKKEEDDIPIKADPSFPIKSDPSLPLKRRPSDAGSDADSDADGGDDRDGISPKKRIKVEPTNDFNIADSNFRGLFRDSSTKSIGKSDIKSEIKNEPNDNVSPMTPMTPTLQNHNQNQQAPQIQKSTKTACIAGGPSSSIQAAAHIDNRATVARAILCAAAAVVFQGLTPDFTGNDVGIKDWDAMEVERGESGTGGSVVKRESLDDYEPDPTKSSTTPSKKKKWDIDPLDVPQNDKSYYRHGSGIGGNEQEGTDEEEDEDDADTNKIGGGVAGGGGSGMSEDSTKKKKLKMKVNMGAVLVQAKTLGNRVLDHANGAARRSDRRREFRMDSALSRIGRESILFQNGYRGGGGGIGSSSSILTHGYSVAPAHSLPLVIPNPFSLMDSDDDEDRSSGSHKALGTDFEDEDSDDMEYFDQHHLHNHHKRELTDGPSIAPWKNPNASMESMEWTNRCLPRMLSVLKTGPGHAILHDLDWENRAFRVAELFQNLAVPNLTHLNAIPESIGKEYVQWQDLRLAGRSTPSSIRGYPNYGPHLIVTGSEDFESFAAVFGQLGHGLGVVSKNGASSGGVHGSESFPTNPDQVLLRVLPYNGPKSKRRRLRKHFGTSSPSPNSPFCFLSGLPDSPYHVILTTYAAFVEDYVHFCQIPFQAVVLDDGMSWLGCAHCDASGSIGKVWEGGIWNNSDYGAGMGGVSGGFGSAGGGGGGVGAQHTYWDFSKDDGGIEADNKKSLQSDANNANSTSSSSKKEGEGNKRGKLLVGLTARHRILLASKMHNEYRGLIHKAPVPSLLSFFTPQFTEVVRDDWERSRVYNCNKSMAYIRSLIARSVVVHDPDNEGWDLYSSAIKSMEGELSSSRSMNYDLFEDELTGWVTGQKIAQSRKFAAGWFVRTSSIFSDLGSISLDPILNALKTFNASGFVCEEVVTASSLTTSGAGGMVAGPAAYRAAVRCGRSFGSEQGLRQHIAALHAPPGTWLCRSCGGDCGTSQARTHHERNCGVIEGGGQGSLGGGVPTVGQGIGSSKGPKQKQAKNLAAAGIQADKDEDGSFRVPGYKGVWVKPNGKHFVKIDGEPIMDDSKEAEEDEEKGYPLLFDSVEDAAKKFDEVVTERGILGAEMNFRADGTRIVYEDSAHGAAAGRSVEMLGGGASSVVPALSVINIKDLPKNVKPLLRDPKQTSRTGGNSKRYVYAYRGVCRQARKGHDRWQSQISFGGTNHYLGTFDSEWDAAAVYAWAHLILYGEEATQKAQREGEEAAAAYEQEKKDIAEGKIPPPAPKPAKKKKKKPGAPKKHDKDGDNQKKPIGGKSSDPAGDAAPVEPVKKKLPKTIKEWNALKTECAMMLSSGTKGTSKVTILATRKDIAESNDDKLFGNITQKLEAGSNSFLTSINSFSKYFAVLPACVSISDFAPSSLPSQSALLIGLKGSDFSWEAGKFITLCRNASCVYAGSSAPKLAEEFGEGGCNESFRAISVSSICTFGRASKDAEKIYSSIGISDTLGMSVRDLGCNVGGPEHSCSELAAKIEYLPTNYGKFQFMACNDDDIVTLNGRRIISSMGPFPLKNRDICSIGARVFVFIQRYSSK